MRFKRLKEHHAGSMGRLQAASQLCSILDVEVPEVLRYVAPGRNLAVLVESATRAHTLRMRGINPLNEFVKKQQAIIGKPTHG